MYTIIMTGGIASGKTTAAQIFAKCGAGIVDTDDLARTLLLENTALIQKILDHFGPTITKDGQSIDRLLLRKHIFQYPQERQFLEACLHPPIMALLRTRISALKTPYAIAVVPLLLESPYVELADIKQLVLVVDTPTELQIKRLRLRGWTEDEIAGVLAAQVSRRERLAVADDILRNDDDTSIQKLFAQIQPLHARYLKYST